MSPLPDAKETQDLLEQQRRAQRKPAPATEPQVQGPGATDRFDTKSPGATPSPAEPSPGGVDSGVASSGSLFPSPDVQFTPPPKPPPVTPNRDPVVGDIPDSSPLEREVGWESWRTWMKAAAPRRTRQAISGLQVGTGRFVKGLITASANPHQPFEPIDLLTGIKVDSPQFVPRLIATAVHGAAKTFNEAAAVMPFLSVGAQEKMAKYGEALNELSVGYEDMDRHMMVRQLEAGQWLYDLVADEEDEARLAEFHNTEKFEDDWRSASGIAKNMLDVVNIGFQGIIENLPSLVAVGTVGRKSPSQAIALATQMAGSFEIMSRVEAGGFLEQAIASGVDPLLARKYGRVYGALAGVVETAQMIMFAKRMFGGVKGPQPGTPSARREVIEAMAKTSFGKKLLKQLAEITGSGTEELIQGGLEYILLHTMADEWEDSGQVPLDRSQWGWDGTGDFIAGASMSLVTGGAGAARQLVSQGTLDASKQFERELDTLDEYERMVKAMPEEDIEAVAQMWRLRGDTEFADRLSPLAVEAAHAPAAGQPDAVPEVRVFPAVAEARGDAMRAIAKKLKLTPKEVQARDDLIGEANPFLEESDPAQIEVAVQEGNEQAIAAQELLKSRNLEEQIADTEEGGKSPLAHVVDRRYEKSNAAVTARNRTRERDVAANPRRHQVKVEMEVERVAEALDLRDDIKINVLQPGELSNTHQATLEATSTGAAGIEAYFDKATGEVTIISDNVSAEDVPRLILHEVTLHKGLHEAYGEGRVQSVLDQLYDSKNLQEQFDFMAKRYADLDPTTDKGRREIMEEVLAYSAEQRTQDPTLWRKTVARMRQMFRDMGLKVQFTDNDIESLLYAGRREVRARSAAGEAIDFLRPTYGNVQRERGLPYAEAFDSTKLSGALEQDYNERVAKTKATKATAKVAATATASKVSLHSPQAQRKTRVTTDKTVLSADEKTQIKAATGITQKQLGAEIRAHKSKHPTTGKDPWAPLIFTGYKAKTEGGKKEITYKTIPYSFDQQLVTEELDDTEFGEGAKTEVLEQKPLVKGTPEYDARVTSLAGKTLENIRKIKKRMDEGDAAAKSIIRQAGWYKNMRSRIRREFGGLGDVFADILGALSPNTPVRTNWDTGLDMLRKATRGDFDQQMPEWVAWIDELDAYERGFAEWFQRQLDEGHTIKNVQHRADLPAALANEYDRRHDEYKAIRERGRALVPLKDSGVKYGFNGVNGIRALVGLWRIVQEADTNIGKGATAPKAVNFSGNLAGYEQKATIDVWAARFLQRHAGGRRIPSMAEGAVGGVRLPDTTATGAFGFGQDVFGLAAELVRGDADLATVDALRDLNPDDLQALVWFIEKEIWTEESWTTAAGEGGSFEFEADLAGSASQARIKELRKIIDGSVTQAMIKKAKGDVAAATATHKANQKAAELELETYHRPLDRFIAGLSTETAGHLTTNKRMGRLGKQLLRKLRLGDRVRAIVSMKAMHSVGVYGDQERSLDYEVTAREDFDPTTMLRGILETAQEHNQDSVFLARVLRYDEDHDVNTHRPGVEVYFKDHTSLAAAAPILERLKQDGIEMYTVSADGRRMPNTIAGEMGNVVGVRLISMPEFNARFGDHSFREKTDAELGQEAADQSEKFDKIIDELNELTEIAFAGSWWYEVDAIFNHEYEGRLNELTNQGHRAADQGGNRGAWRGRSVREASTGAAPGDAVLGNEAEGGGQVQRGDPGEGGLRASRRGPASLKQAVKLGKPLPLRHWSQDQRDLLDPKFHGTGIRGAEGARKKAYPRHYVARLYFGGPKYKKEGGLGATLHTVQVAPELMYDINNDPDNLFPTNVDAFEDPQKVISMYEKAIKKAGYLGFWVSNSTDDVAALFEPVQPDTNVLGRKGQGLLVEELRASRARPTVSKKQRDRTIRQVIAKQLPAEDLVQWMITNGNPADRASFTDAPMPVLKQMARTLGLATDGPRSQMMATVDDRVQMLQNNYDNELRRAINAPDLRFSKVEVSPGKWVEARAGKMNLSRKLMGIEKYNHDTDTFSYNENTFYDENGESQTFESPEKRRELIARYNAGERWEDSLNVSTSRKPPPIPPGMKPRRFMERVAGDERFVDIRDDLEASPQYAYTPQSYAEINEELEGLDDRQLSASLEKAGEWGAVQSSKNYAVLAGLKLIEREEAKGRDITPTLEQLARLSTSAAQLLRQYAELKTSTPAGAARFVAELVSKPRRSLTPVEVEGIKERLAENEHKLPANDDIDAALELIRQAERARNILERAGEVEGLEQMPPSRTIEAAEAIIRNAENAYALLNQAGEVEGAGQQATEAELDAARETIKAAESAQALLEQAGEAEGQTITDEQRQQAEALLKEATEAQALLETAGEVEGLGQLPSPEVIEAAKSVIRAADEAKRLLIRAENAYDRILGGFTSLQGSRQLLDNIKSKRTTGPLETPKRVLTSDQKDKVKLLAAQDLDARGILRTAEEAYQNDPNDATAKAWHKAQSEAEAAAQTFLRYVQTVSPRDLSRDLVMLLQGNLLVPLSQMRNIIGNLSYTPLRLITHQIAASADAVDAFLTGSERRVKGHTFAQVKEGLRGVGRGLVAAGKQVKTGVAPDTLIQGETIRGFQPLVAWHQALTGADMPVDPRTGKVPVGDRVYRALLEGSFAAMHAEGQFRLLALGDAPFKQGERRKALQEAAELLNIPKDRRALFLEFPPKHVADLAENQAAEAVYQQENALAAGIQKIFGLTGQVASPRTKAALTVLARTQMPYVKTPLNLAWEGMQYVIPELSFARSVGDRIRASQTTGEESARLKRSAAINLGKSVTGGMLWAAGSWLVSHGLLVGEPAEDPRERGLQYGTVGPNRVNMSGLIRVLMGKDGGWLEGDDTRDFMSFGFAGIVFHVIANHRKLIDDEESSRIKKQRDTLNALGSMQIRLLQTAKATLDLAALKGTASFLEAMSTGDEYVARRWQYNMVQAVSSMALPNTMDALARAKMIHIPNSTADTTVERFRDIIRLKLSGLPGAGGVADELSYRRDMLGRPIKIKPASGLSRMLDTSKRAVIPDDPYMRLMYDVWERNEEDNGALPSAPNRTVKLGGDINDGNSVWMGRDELTRLYQEVGSARMAKMDPFLQNPDFDDQPPERQMELLRAAYTNGRATGLAAFRKWWLTTERGQRIKASPTRTAGTSSE